LHGVASNVYRRTGGTIIRRVTRFERLANPFERDVRGERVAER
jgi:hypothetical protein